MVRSHQLVLEGHKLLWAGAIATIFSAPNYCYRCGNAASIMQINEKLEATFKTYKAVQD